MDKKDRDIVFNKFGGKCAYCGCDLGKSFHVDHIMPVKRKKKIVEGQYIDTIGGQSVWVKRHFVNDGFDFPERDVFSNKVAACGSCNINKRDQTLEQFRDMITHFVKSLNTRFVQYQMAKKYGLLEETGKPVVFYFESLTPQPPTHE